MDFHSCVVKILWINTVVVSFCFGESYNAIDSGLFTQSAVCIKDSKHLWESPSTFIGRPQTPTSRAVTEGLNKASDQKSLVLLPLWQLRNISDTIKTSGIVQDLLIGLRDVTPSGVQRWCNSTGYQRVKQRSCPEVTHASVLTPKIVRASLTR